MVRWDQRCGLAQLTKVKEKRDMGVEGIYSREWLWLNREISAVQTLRQKPRSLRRKWQWSQIDKEQGEVAGGRVDAWNPLVHLMEKGGKVAGSRNDRQGQYLPPSRPSGTGGYTFFPVWSGGGNDGSWALAEESEIIKWACRMASFPGQPGFAGVSWEDSGLWTQSGLGLKSRSISYYG